MSDHTKVMGVLDNMDEYATLSARMGDDLEYAGRRVGNAIETFNQSSEPSYNVGNSGVSLAVLGDQVREIDSFVKSIADALRQADTDTISIKMGSVATDRILYDAVALERAAGDIALFYLLKDFAAFDAINDGKSDGIVSAKDIETAALISKDPKVRASAAWLREHRDVWLAIDVADARPLATPDGKVTAKDVARYMRQRAAYQVFSTNIAVFDDPDPKNRDGKVSRNDIERVVKTAADPNLRAAAQYLLDDERVLNNHVSFGDQVAGRYDLSKVASRYAEPKSPLPLQKNWVRDIGCGAAKQFSYLAYLDMVDKVLVGDVTVIDDAEQNYLQRFALDHVAATATRETLRKSAATLASPQFAAAATVIDGVCRITEPRKDWGTVVGPRDKKKDEETGPPSSVEILSKQNAKAAK